MKYLRHFNENFMAYQKIPSVDLADFRSGSEERKKHFVQQLGKAYEEIGFVALKNHFLEPNLEKSLYDEVEAFFALPEKVKKKYEPEGMAGQRGYVSFGREHAKNRQAADLKEFWHFGQYVEDDDPEVDYPPNLAVKERPRYNEVGKEAYQKLEETGRYVLRAIALHLGLPETYFDAKIHNGNSILRPIHYPPIQGEPGSAVRAGEHEDINLITLLMGASAEGLEVKNRAGAYIPVTALPEQVIVNVGDMLQRLTNNQLRSTTHRVVNPPPEKWGSSRYSIPFFLHPRSKMRLDCLPTCVDKNNPRQYDDISAGAYLEQRLREIGLKK